MADNRSQPREEQSQEPQKNENRSRSSSLASLSLGLLSIMFALGPIILFILFPLFGFPLNPALVVGLGILSAILGLTLGIRQVIRHRSERVLACIGMFFSLVGGGLSSLVVYGMFVFTVTHVDILTRMGYEHNVIDNPISVEFFQAVDEPTAQWIYSGAVVPLGWYSDDQEVEIPIEIPLTGSDPTEPVSFDPGDSIFGFFIRFDGVYEWFTESERNEDGESHVRVYPMIIDGSEVPNSYLICWEDYPLNTGPHRFVDFTDLIVRVDGVRPVSPLAEE